MDPFHCATQIVVPPVIGLHDLLSRYPRDEVLRRADMTNKSLSHNVGVLPDRPLKHDPSMLIPYLSHPVFQSQKLTVPNHL